MHNRTAGTKPRYNLESVRCNLGGADDTEFLFQAYDLWHNLDAAEHPRYNVVRCRQCGLTYVNPRIPAAEMSALYPEDYVSHSGRVREPTPLSARGMRAAHWRRQVFETWHGDDRAPVVHRLWLSLIWHSRRMRYDVLRFRGEGRGLLDVGCGIGNYLADKRALGWEVCGVEPAPRPVEVCHSRGLNVVEGLFDPGRWTPNSFDAVTLHHVIEYAPDPRDLLTQVFVVVKPGGIIYITTPNIRSIPAGLFTTYWIGMADVPRHCFFYTPKTMSCLLHKAGFRVMHWYTISSTSGYTAALEFILRERFKLDIGRDRVRKNAVLARMVLPLVRLGDWVKLGDNLHIIAQKRES